MSQSNPSGHTIGALQIAGVIMQLITHSRPSGVLRHELHCEGQLGGMS
jgi:hypothetical protein